MAGADRQDRLVKESACQGSTPLPSFRARCAEWSSSTDHSIPARQPDLVAGLVRVLDRALRALGDQGQQDHACRLAAEAWALLEPGCEREARRLNGTLHYLTRESRG